MSTWEDLLAVKWKASKIGLLDVCFSVLLTHSRCFLEVSYFRMIYWCAKCSIGSHGLSEVVYLGVPKMCRLRVLLSWWTLVIQRGSQPRLSRRSVTFTPNSTLALRAFLSHSWRERPILFSRSRDHRTAGENLSEKNTFQEKKPFTWPECCQKLHQTTTEVLSTAMDTQNQQTKSSASKPQDLNFTPPIAGVQIKRCFCTTNSSFELTTSLMAYHLQSFTKWIIYKRIMCHMLLLHSSDHQIEGDVQPSKSPPTPGRCLCLRTTLYDSYPIPILSLKPTNPTPTNPTNQPSTCYQR